MKKIKVCFRVDTGEVVGTGHLMEALAIYKSLKNRFAVEAAFITVKNDYIVTKLRQAGIKKIYPVAEGVTAEDVSELEDTNRTIEVFKRNKFDCLIVDLPKRSESYYKKLNKNIGLVCTILDDDLYREIQSTLVFNFSITQNAQFYRGFNNKSRYLVGPEYIPLNEDMLEFKPIKIKRKIKRILVTTPAFLIAKYGTTVKIIEALEKIEGDFMIDVLISGLIELRHQKEIDDTIRSSVKHEYVLNKNILQRKVFEISEKADIAITASGNALYEFAYFGLPTIMIAPRIEFLKITDCFEKSVFNTNLGLVDLIGESTLKESLESLINNYELRKKNSLALRGLVDGMGTNRICERILTLIRNK